MNELNEDQVVDLLRSAAPSRPTSANHIADMHHRAGRIRRRRRVASVAGAGAAGIAMVVGIAAIGSGTGNGSQTVVQPAGDPVRTAAPAAAAVATPGPPSEAHTLTVPAGKGGESDFWAGQHENVAILLDKLGPDFRRGSDKPNVDQGPVVLREDRVTALGLPAGYTAIARVNVFVDADDESHFTLANACRYNVDDGSVHEACEPLTLDNGKTVYIQHGRASRTDLRISGPWDSTLVYFPRSDGTFVRIEFAAYDQADRASKARQDKALAWLHRYDQQLAEAISDDGIRPAPGKPDHTPTVAPVTSHDRDLVILQQALGESFGIFNGKLALEPNVREYKDLPELAGVWEGPADIGTVSDDVFRAACNTENTCRRTTTRDGQDIWTYTWAVRDSDGKGYSGVSSAWLVRPDGSALRAEVKLSGSQETTMKSGLTDDVRTWLERLETRLEKAVSNPDVKG